jgi:hydrogenase maturation protease
MNLAAVEQIARAVLYEGYLLYPYRASSIKNRHRWTFGGLYPPAFCREKGGSDTSELLTECLVRGGPKTIVEVQARFLHLVERTLEDPSGRSGDSRQEAVEGSVAGSEMTLGELVGAPHRRPFSFPGSRERAPAEGGWVVRVQEEIDGLIEVSASPLEEGLFKLTVRVANVTALPASEEADREKVLLRSLVSTHVVLGVREGEFLSLMGPPEEFREAASRCRNVGVWPVLVGDEGDTDTMLASPIILYDHPQVAPESPGDLFDGTEIDEILTLRILTLTEGEKQEVSAGDELGRNLLARTEALARERLLGLHGTFRPTPPEADQIPEEGP